MSRRARSVTLSSKQRQIMESFSRSRTLPQRLVERATMIVWSADGLADAAQARRLGVDEQRPRRWRKRWLVGEAALKEAETSGATERELAGRVIALLSDANRPGTPPKFSPEQVAQLIALACERPEDSGLPVTHWTPQELAQEARKRSIVEEISPRHLDRILKRGRSATA